MIATIMMTMALMGFVPANVLVDEQANTSTNHTAWFASVPQTHRSAFLRRFDKVVNLREQAAWADLYNLRYSNDGLTKAQFEKSMSVLDQLIEFRPMIVFYVPPSQSWVIKGCAQYRDKSGRVYSAPSSMHGFYSDGLWLFGDIGIDITQTNSPKSFPCTT